MSAEGTLGIIAGNRLFPQIFAREACRAFGLDAVSVSEADILEGSALALADGSLTRG